MRGTRFICAALVLAPMMAWAQSGSLKAYVPNKEIVEGRQFWLVIEASGATVQLSELPVVDGVVINTDAAQQSTRVAFGGGVQQQEMRVSFPAIPIRAGKVTIPAIQAVVNGRTLQTEPIELDAKPAPPSETKEAPVRAWVDTTDVEVGGPFWIYIEAKGIEIELPETLSIDGIVIDPVNVQRSVSYSIGREGQMMNARRGYLAVTTREGEITIPPIEVKVTGRIVKTEPIRLTSKKVSLQAAAPGDAPSDTELTQDDLLFVRMETDKTTAYQGEPILLSQQLFRIQNRRINSGPNRAALITGPSVEGFFTVDLEPLQYEKKVGPWMYDVIETRRLLYPTRPGTLRVGVWHWEGIALVDRQSVTQRDKLHYRFDQGPIDITVKPLPPAPDGFTGAVGQFTVEASLSSAMGTQGVPVALIILVTGSGNPDSIGDPVLPAMSWASTRDPQRTTKSKVDDKDKAALPTLEKRFAFPITPLKAGHGEIPAFPFVFFDTAKNDYTTVVLGPFGIDVMASGEENTHVLASPDVPAAQRHVEILAEDIRPMMPRPATLASARRSGKGGWFVLAFVAPALAYAGVRIVLGKKRRLATDVGFARSQRARSSGLKRLRDVAQSADPAETLFRAVTAYVADALNLGEAALTSGDVQRELSAASVPRDLTDRTVQILRACERAQYASQKLSRDEVTALISAAESCMHALEDVKSARRKQG